MRVLKPEIVEDRKRKVLQWVIHRYMKSSAPISSKSIAEEGTFGLSPATIRNVLKELEDEGFLESEHASSGRVPTDKGYRLYVDYLVEMRRLAAEERQKVESEYRRRVAEFDELLVQTSRMLSHMSHSAGFALSPKLGRQPVQRLELVALGPTHVLLVLVTTSGVIRHWPLQLPVPVTPEKVALLGRYLNDRLQGLTVTEIRESLFKEIERAEREFRDLGEAARLVLDQVSDAAGPEELYVDGASALASIPGSDPADLRRMLSVVEDRRRLARLLQEEFDGQLKRRASGPTEVAAIEVRIGDENLPELRSLSLVTTTYRVNEQTVGLLGILGPRHMEYPKMMAVVRFIGDLVSETLHKWEDVYGDARDPGKSGR